MAFPDSFLTPRLEAIRLRPEHREEIHRMHQDEQQMALIGGVRSEEQTTEYMATSLRHWDDHGFGVWLLRESGADEVIGRVLLRMLRLDDVDEIEVGYSFRPSAWGRGLATEVASACVAYARDPLGFPSIVALTRPENLASQNVLIKSGLQRERELELYGNRQLLFRTPPPS